MIFLQISTWWNGLEGFDQFFWGLAIVSSVLFVFFFILSLVGIDFEGAGDISADISGDMADDAHSFEVDPFFKLLSFRSVVAFLTFFSWIGILALSKGYSRFWILFWALAAGLAAMFLVAYLLYFFSQLGESGTSKWAELAGQKAVVYLAIPAKMSGQGKIHVIWNHSLKEIEAMTKSDLPLQNGTEVKIKEITKDNIALVESGQKA